MKNQYFGDIGDYLKYPPLKSPRDIGGYKILVHWLKTKDDEGRDGRHIAYLNDAKRWDRYV